MEAPTSTAQIRIRERDDAIPIRRLTDDPNPLLKVPGPSFKPERPVSNRATRAIRIREDELP
jgi:hypothetical protein